eukprot:scaffold56121_cov36-Phaeocystis_antarctica.AAC.1
MPSSSRSSSATCRPAAYPSPSAVCHTGPEPRTSRLGPRPGFVLLLTRVRLASDRPRAAGAPAQPPLAGAAGRAQ